MMREYLGLKYLGLFIKARILIRNWIRIRSQTSGSDQKGTDPIRSGSATLLETTFTEGWVDFLHFLYFNESTDELCFKSKNNKSKYEYPIGFT
jgi:hypothetical protein